MNLYLISRKDGEWGYEWDYEAYDSAVVCAASADDAIAMHPGGAEGHIRTWVPPNDVAVKFLGLAHPTVPRGVVCASFNAG